MLSQEKLQKFAELCVKIGVNLQKGQNLVINCPVECADIAHVLAEKAYEAGAKKVLVDYIDQKLSRLAFLNQDIETLSDIPQYVIDRRMSYVKDRACIISISAGDPSIYAGIPAEKLKASSVATRTALKDYQAATMSNYLRWLVVSVPTANWAKKIFPNAADAQEACDKLWDAIAVTMRLNEKDPVEAWRKHVETLTRRAKFLNDNNFDYLHMTSKNGTDLKVGLAEDHVWMAAEEDAQDGHKFIANMPTEEIFTAPHKDNVNGIVHNALPLVNNGNIIDDFAITFKDGKVVDFTAKTGYEALKNIIETDEGSHHIGEVALIGKNSPIHNTGLMFYNTLFDENASCHLAFGKAYPTTIKNGNDLTKEELLKKGCNDSMEHCDYMIGTTDMNIVGVKKDGTKIQLFVDGEWVI